MMEATCRSGVEVLVDYLEGQLPPAVVTTLEGHVAGCQKCQAFLASYHATPRIIRDATEGPFPAGLELSLLTWLRDQR